MPWQAEVLQASVKLWLRPIHPLQSKGIERRAALAADHQVRMCTNYRATSRDLLRARGISLADDREYPPETYPGYLAPMVRSNSTGELQCALAGFGLVPYWAEDKKFPRHTYNCRSETVASKPSFRNAWRNNQRCLIPMTAFFEPHYGSGKPVRWRIERADGDPIMVAGIFDTWRAPDADWWLSFSMLAINADSDPLMKQFHAPTDEKRSLVAIDRANWAQWLNTGNADVHHLLAPGIDADSFAATSDPRVSRVRTTSVDSPVIEKRLGLKCSTI